MTIDTNTEHVDFFKEKIAFTHLFPQLSKDECEFLIDKSSFRQFAAGSVICREGEYGDTSYAIMDGSVEISINTEGHDNLPLAILEEGNIFGEMAALSGYSRNATVTAKEEITILEIPAEVLKDLMKRSLGFKEIIDNLYNERAVRNYIRKVPFFMNLNDSTLDHLEKRVNLLSYNQGDVIFSEGETGDSLYIIRTGFVKVTKKKGSDDQIIAYIAHGNYFGEMALIEDEKRSATVSAFTKTEVIQLLKEDFNMLLEMESNLGDEIKDIIVERKLKTFEVQTDTAKAERLETLVEKGFIQAENLLIIDLKRCIRCNNCVDSCEARHGYPRLDRRGTRFGEISVPVACRLCHDPLCLICNFDAIKRAPTGEVYVIDEKCVGSGGCAIRCPYNVIKMVSTDSKHKSWFDIMGTLLKIKQENKEGEKENEDLTAKPKRLAIKCDTCMGYSDTACTKNCPTQAIRYVNPLDYFADIDKDVIPKTRKYQ